MHKIFTSVFIVGISFAGFALADAPPPPPDLFFDQLINPNTPEDVSPKNLFKQRYIFNSDWAKGVDSPVLYFLGNEADMGLLLQDSWIPEIAKTLGAYFVGLEHRYYGKSQPFPMMTTENLKYLTTANALADFARFEKYLIETKGLKGKWITVGRSYGGSLSAYYRLLYPQLVAGAYASSPALKWAKYLPDWDRKAAESVGPDCLKAYRSEILDPLIDALEKKDKAKLDEARKIFDAADIDDDTVFVDTVTGTASQVVQMDGTAALCDSLKSKDGPVQGYAKQMLATLKELGMRPVDSESAKAIADPTATKYEGGLGTRQWAYQACTEFGMNGVAYPDPAKSLMSTLTASASDHYCPDAFGLPNDPAIDRMNKQFYEPLLDPKVTKILITNGLNDPTMSLSISKENNNDLNPNLTIYEIAGGDHHQELKFPKDTDPQAVKDARAFVIKTLSDWSN